MTPQQLDAYLAQKEAEKQLQPGELRSIWQQESSKSLDPNLKGPALSRGRGNAQGPFQIVSYYHGALPKDLPGQADMAADIYARGGETPEQRAAKYYGTGTAPKGQPSTAQYVQQVLSRLPAEPVPPPSESMPIPTQTVAYQEPTMPTQEELYAQQAQQQQLQPQQQAPEQGWSLEGALSNPWTQFGMGVLAAPGNYGDPSFAIASGANAVQNAGYQRQKAENELYELQVKRLAALQKTKEGRTKFGTGLNVVNTPQGPKIVQLNDAGEIVYTDAPGLPVTHDPNVAGQKSIAEQAGKTGIKAIGEQYIDATNARDAVNATTDVLGMIDKGVLTGKYADNMLTLGNYYASLTGKPLAAVDNTQAMRAILGDVVLPALTSMKGASSDKDVVMIQEYSGGKSDLTPGALKLVMERLNKKYGDRIEEFNTMHSGYLAGGNAPIPGIRTVRPRTNAAVTGGAPSGFDQNLLKKYGGQ